MLVLLGAALVTAPRGARAQCEDPGAALEDAREYLEDLGDADGAVDILETVRIGCLDALTPAQKTRFHDLSGRAHTWQNDLAGAQDAYTALLKSDPAWRPGPAYDKDAGAAFQDALKAFLRQAKVELSMQPAAAAFEWLNVSVTPAKQDLVLKATGDRPARWRAAANADWLRVTPAEGVVPPGGQTTISVSVDKTKLGAEVRNLADTLTVTEEDDPSAKAVAQITVAPGSAGGAWYTDWKVWTIGAVVVGGAAAAGGGGGGGGGDGGGDNTLPGLPSLPTP